MISVGKSILFNVKMVLPVSLGETTWSNPPGSLATQDMVANSTVEFEVPAMFMVGGGLSLDPPAGMGEIISSAAIAGSGRRVTMWSVNNMQFIGQYGDKARETTGVSLLLSPFFGFGRRGDVKQADKTWVLERVQKALGKPGSALASTFSQMSDETRSSLENMIVSLLGIGLQKKAVLGAVSDVLKWSGNSDMHRAVDAAPKMIEGLVAKGADPKGVLEQLTVLSETMRYDTSSAYVVAARLNAAGLDLESMRTILAKAKRLRLSRGGYPILASIIEDHGVNIADRLLAICRDGLERSFRIYGHLKEAGFGGEDLVAYYSKATDFDIDATPTQLAELRRERRDYATVRAAIIRGLGRAGAPRPETISRPEHVAHPYNPVSSTFSVSSGRPADLYPEVPIFDASFERAIRVLGPVSSPFPSPFRHVAYARPIREREMAMIDAASEHLRVPVSGFEDVFQLLGSVRKSHQKVVSTQSGAYDEAVSVFEGACAHIALIFENFDSGDTALPPDNVLTQYAFAWLLAVVDLQRHYAKTDAAKWRDMFWGMLDKTLKVSHEAHRNALISLGKDDLSLLLLIAEFKKESTDSTRSDNFINYDALIKKMADRGLVVSPCQYGANLPADEMLPDGGSQYVKDVLLPLHKKILPDDYPEKGRKIFFIFLAEYQKARAGFPSVPDDMIETYVVEKTHEKAKLTIDPFIDKDWISNLFHNMHRGISRFLATIPDEQWGMYERQILRDFPEAGRYRAGLKQVLDTRAIERAMSFPASGEDMIMHIGVNGSDMPFVKESLSHLSAQGQVVIVDINGNCLKPFRDDPEIRAAIENKRLVVEETDAFGPDSKAFRRKYSRKVTRVYLVHPNGDSKDTLYDFMATGGKVVIQTDEKNKMWTRSRYIELFAKGDFERLAGYKNGPAWFKSSTAVEILHNAGIHLIIGRRRK